LPENGLAVAAFDTMAAENRLVFAEHAVLVGDVAT
jgi:hypothetical protein